MTRGSWLALATLGLLAGFALLAGEYDVFDLGQLRRAARQEADSVAVLQRAVDSLEAVLQAVRTDPAEQERIAREQWGMLREGEFGYRILRESPDSGSP